MSNEMRYQQGQNKKGIEKEERNRDNEKYPTLFPELYCERNNIKKNISVTPFPFNSLIVKKKKKRHEKEQYTARQSPIHFPSGPLRKKNPPLN